MRHLLDLVSFSMLLASIYYFFFEINPTYDLRLVYFSTTGELLKTVSLLSSHFLPFPSFSVFFGVLLVIYGVYFRILSLFFASAAIAFETSDLRDLTFLLIFSLFFFIGISVARHGLRNDHAPSALHIALSQRDTTHTPLSQERLHTRGDHIDHFCRQEGKTKTKIV